MHDFVSYLFYLLQRGMRFAVPAALICGLILAVCYAVCRKKGRRFPWGKAVCAVLLVGWAVITVFVTLLRSEPNEFAARQWNLQLFRSWRRVRKDLRKAGRREFIPFIQCQTARSHSPCVVK